MKFKYLPIASALFLVMAMAVQFVVSYRRNVSNLLERIDDKMALAQKDFSSEVKDMSDATAEIAHFLPEYMDKQDGYDYDDLYGLTETVLWHYPDLFSCVICFVPNYFPDKGERYAVCSLRMNGDSITSYHFEDKLNYFEREWYCGAMLSDEHGFWSQPYIDIDTRRHIFTHSRQLYDEQGNVIGVASTDCTLEWTSRMLINTRPYADAVCRLYSSTGTLIVQVGTNTDDSHMITSERVLSPGDMRLEISVPEHHVWDGISQVSVITFIVLLIGIGIGGLLIRIIWREQQAYTRVETANRVMEHELHIASNIQKGILREGRRPHFQAWQDVSLQAMLVPMREVGGDLYDFYRKDDDLYFLIGDVSGKSVTAAMFMSATVNLFRSAVRRLPSPKDIMEEMNGVLSDNNPSMMFVTAFIGRLHVPTGQLLYCNAGHFPPLKLSPSNSDSRPAAKQSNSDSRPRAIALPTNPNIPLGYDANYSFAEQGTMIAQGETLVLYTDGITEMRNCQHHMLGAQRWTEIVADHQAELIAGDMAALLGACHSFSGNTEQADDITLMAIHKLSDTQPMTIHVDNHLDRWYTLRQALHNYGVCANIPPRQLKQLQVALEEVVANINHHSQATYITMSCQTTTPAGLQVTVTDDGIPFDPTAQPPTDTNTAIQQRQIGGIGLTLLNSCTDKLQYTRLDNKNILTITAVCDRQSAEQTNKT